MIFSKDHKGKHLDKVFEQQNAGFLTGKLLVSTPEIERSCFAKSVVLVCDHSKNGGMGIIINKHLRNIDQKDLYTKLGLDKTDNNRGELPVYFGGPIDTTRGFVVHSGDYMSANSINLGEGVVITSEHQVLKDYINFRGPEKLMLAMGYAGWTPGQLEKELEENSWLALPLDSELVFDVHDDSKWQKTGAKYGIDVSRVETSSTSIN